jgi:hypothetical protein
MRLQTAVERFLEAYEDRQRQDAFRTLGRFGFHASRRFPELEDLKAALVAEQVKV